MGKLRQLLSEIFILAAGVVGGMWLSLNTMPLTADECWGWVAVYAFPQTAYLIAILMAIGLALFLKFYKE